MNSNSMVLDVGSGTGHHVNSLNTKVLHVKVWIIPKQWSQKQKVLLVVQVLNMEMLILQ